MAPNQQSVLHPTIGKAAPPRRAWIAVAQAPCIKRLASSIWPYQHATFDFMNTTPFVWIAMDDLSSHNLDWTLEDTGAFNGGFVDSAMDEPNADSRGRTPEDMIAVSGVFVGLGIYDSGAYNQNWTTQDQLALIANGIHEREVSCQWVDHDIPCGDIVKWKDFKAHLCDRHGVTSDSQLYWCRWLECSYHRQMKGTSLERHVKEQHLPVRWACPSCDQVFTRDSTLTNHFGSTHGHP